MRAHKTKKQFDGFALVVSLSLMILLTIIAVGLLGLSAVTLRGTIQGEARAKAQANARLALMMAIGELQKHAGADTRITAPADIVVPNAPNMTGVWKSWEGTNHDPRTGRPIRPDYSVKTEGQPGNGRFLTWLVSGADLEPSDSPSDPAPSDLVSNQPKPGMVPLVSERTLGDNDQRQVHLRPRLMGGGTGAYAWWVSPENQKARLTQPHRPDSDDASGWSDMARTHAVADPEPFGFANLLDDPENHTPDPQKPKPGRKAISLNTTQLILDTPDDPPGRNFHDLSVVSTGLLTNTATGGWRKDLSILSEKWNSLGTSGLPMFRLNEASTTTSARPTSSDPRSQGSIFYPWSNYRQNTPTPGNPSPSTFLNQHGAVASWHSLVDYATSYKSVTFDQSRQVASTPVTWARTHRATPWGPASPDYTDTDLFNFLHTNQKSPVLARVQWVFKVRARREPPPKNQPNSNTYGIDLLVTPVYTLWNPHNVEIKINQYFAVALNKTMSVAIAFAKGTENIDYDSPPGASTSFRRYIRGSIADMEGTNGYDRTIPGNFVNDWEESNNQSAGFPQSITLGPGEARQFSLDSNAVTGNTGVMGFLKEGYDGASAFGFMNRIQSATGFQAPIRTGFLLSDSLKIGMRFDNKTRLAGRSDREGPGIFMGFGRWDGPNGGRTTNSGPNRYLGDSFANYSMLTNLEYSKAYWDEPPDLPTLSVQEILNTGSNQPWTPVFSIIWGPRLTIGTGAGNAGNRPTKGLLQSSPFASAVQTDSTALSTNHPANLAFDFNYVGHANGNSETLPEEGIPGYIVSGNTAGNGLSRLIVGEIPLKPISSLAELQGWEMRGRNPLPPFQYNIIGNSDAHPMIPRNDVVINTADPATNLQHDDAYCANHLLFDDWFFSSIAPEPRDFGNAIVRDIDTVYLDYLSGQRPLVNRAYRPILEDTDMENGPARERVREILNSDDGWQKVASRFEVEGMFNINSTSVKAWRAVLGHARQVQVANHTRNGIRLDSSERDHVLSRMSVAPDIQAGNSAGMGGAFPKSSEYSGFRTLTDSQLDDLAEKIVDQVRERGPFLSLSEFINRRLDGDDDLTLSGAVQTALNSLSEDLHSVLKSPDYASPTLAANDERLKGADYRYPQAAVGFDTFGLPGWIRQADVLRPIAPILSARDDTFTIRTYGDSRDASGKIIARAWCEAVVKRTRNFVDREDVADLTVQPTRTSNRIFGRSYDIVSFRWLSQGEV